MNDPHSVESLGTNVRGATGLIPKDVMANALSVSEDTLDVWRTAKKGPPWMRIGKKIYYPLGPFSQWVNAEFTSQQVDQSKLSHPG